MNEPYLLDILTIQGSSRSPKLAGLQETLVQSRMICCLRSVCEVITACLKIEPIENLGVCSGQLNYSSNGSCFKWPGLDETEPPPFWVSGLTTASSKTLFVSNGGVNRVESIHEPRPSLQISAESAYCGSCRQGSIYG
jgi:hypothetical protein